MVREGEQPSIRFEAQTSVATDEGNRLNLIDLVSDSGRQQPAAPDSSTAVTREHLHDVLRRSDHVRYFSLNTPEKIQGQEDQINALEDRDLQAIDGITDILRGEPRGQINATQAQQLDEIFKQYACFPERLRNMLNPLNLHLQSQGLDARSDPRSGVSVDGGYPGWPDDQSQYRVQVNRNRTPQPLYQFTTDEVCS